MQGLTEGSRLADRYVLLRRLGEGGMSEVWTARDERADSVVALKRLKSPFAADSAHRQHFHQEWRLGSRLMHAHIVRVFEYHDDPDAPFFALQYVDGPELGVLANTDLENVLRPLGLLADALRYAHGKSVVHRDIKAANVLLDRNGSPYLLDFGVAAASSGGSPVNQSTAQKAGGVATPADDIYALGVLVHELIWGKPPAAGGPEIGPRPGGESVPEAIVQLVGDMLADDAARRPTAAAVATRLSEAGFSSGTARPPSAAFTPADDIAPTVVALKPVEKKSAASATHAPVAADRSAGVSPTTVYLGLAVLLALFIGVIFILPATVETPTGIDPAEAVAEEPVPADSASSDVESELLVEEPTQTDVTPAVGANGNVAGFSENLSTGGNELQVKRATDDALGDLLSQLERLRYRGIDRWGGQPFLDALDVYALGDEAYLAKNYPAAGNRYREATALLEPFFERIDGEFDEAMTAANTAFERRDSAEAIRLYDLAVAITPGDAAAEKGLRRARNLDAVLDLMNQGEQYRAELALDAAKLAFEKALALDPDWLPAETALQTVRAESTELSFQMRMTEGLDALAAGDFASARAAFNAAKTINPNSPEPGDGLLQVDQEVRLRRIQQMEDEAAALVGSEQWESAVTTYEKLLEVDGDLQFAKEGLLRARERAGVHRQIQSYVEEPDSLSDPATMQRATQLLLNVSRMDPLGPRLVDEKDELSRLLKRAATPLPVSFASDNETEVSIYRVGKLGRFESQSVELRPGQYVATGIRLGFRDVRLEFRVAPEIDMGTIVIKCEEPI